MKYLLLLLLLPLFSFCLAQADSFGMRCASSCYHMLSQIGITKLSSRFRSIREAFHPKALRKKLVKLAKEKGYAVTVQKGSTTRKWEGD